MSNDPTHRINTNSTGDPGSITCLVCGFTSHNTNDIQYLYCGNCHSFHPIRSPEINNGVFVIQSKV